MVAVATLVVHAGGYLFVVFLSVCLATGLYYLAEAVEEYSTFTKRVLTHSVQATLVIHALLLLWDRLPLLCVGTSGLAQVFYLRMLKQFPFFVLTSTDCLAACGLFIASHVVWVRHFLKTWHSLEYILGFFLVVVWLVPFTLFISLAANEQVLPFDAAGSASRPSSYSNAGMLSAADGRGKGTKSLLLTVFNFVRRKRDEVMPEVTRSATSLRKVHNV